MSLLIAFGAICTIVGGIAYYFSPHEPKEPKEPETVSIRIDLPDQQESYYGTMTLEDSKEFMPNRE